jgi:hypothetical protein
VLLIPDLQGKCEALKSRRTWGSKHPSPLVAGSERFIYREKVTKPLGVSLGGTAPSADLGGSSKYSNENFEGRSGERFRENSI